MDINYPLNTYIDKLNELQPDVISGYPTAIKMLLDYQKENKLAINPDSIICGGEPLTEAAYKKIKNNSKININLNNYIQGYKYIFNK